MKTLQAIKLVYQAVAKLGLLKGIGSKKMTAPTGVVGVIIWAAVEAMDGGMSETLTIAVMGCSTVAGVAYMWIQGSVDKADATEPTINMIAGQMLDTIETKTGGPNVNHPPA